MRRAKWKPGRNTVICSRHFENEDFEPFAEHRMKRELKKTAVPTIFDYPEHLQPKKPKLRKPPFDRSLAADSSKDGAAEVERSAIEEQELSKWAVDHDHSYSTPDRMVLKQRLDAAEEEIASLKSKLAAERKKTSFQRKRNQNLKSTLENLKTTGLIESRASDHLGGLLTPTLQELFDRLESSSSKSSRKFPPELRVFASTLHFYSAKAYNYVRETFKKALPHETTIRKWFSNIDGSPGFSTPALQLLKEKVSEGQKLNKPVLVSVMLDEMSLKKQLHYDSVSSSFTGHVDIGEGPCVGELKPATEALVIMVVGINWHFKIPIAYFFIAGDPIDFDFILTT